MWPMSNPGLVGHHRHKGLLVLTGFFAFGAAMASLAVVALLWPGGGLEAMWRLNPQAHSALQGMGRLAVVLMGTVAGACGLAAWGLWTRTRWGHSLAVAVLVVNLIGDTANALIRGDLRTLVGLPIGGALIAYLLSAKVRGEFSADGEREGKRLSVGGPRPRRDWPSPRNLLCPPTRAIMCSVRETRRRHGQATNRCQSR